jgi:hexosaminidase
MLDVCRHFQTVDTIKKLLDQMAREKLNVFHFHLTDDQGWRLESQKFLRFIEVGALRASSALHGNRRTSDGIPYGPYFYTAAGTHDLIAYGHVREITIVPEIEMSGHAITGLAAPRNSPAWVGYSAPRRPGVISMTFLRWE